MGKRARWSRLVVCPVGAALICGCVSPVRLLLGPSRTVAASTVALGTRREGAEQAAREARSEAAELKLPESDGVALVQMLPVGGDRCSVAQPGLVSAEERALIALVSQTESWPWAFPLEVRAYARAERSPSLGQRAVVEYVRFATDQRAVIEVALARMLARPLRYTDATSPEPEDGCDGELTCSPLSARFVDANTVRLAHGDWGEPGGAPNACIDALREAPSALEVSARSAWISGTDLRDSRARLELSGDGVLRTTIRHYAEVAAAERALRAAQLGQDELATLAGVAASSLGEQEGDRLVQTTFASFADLRLAAADQARAAAQIERAREPLAVDRVDPRDADAVRAAVDAQLASPRANGPRSAAQLAQLAALLERASAFHPDDAGLARRQYQLALGLRHDPRAAFVIAVRVQARKLDDAAAWQLRARAALALFDEAQLRAALSTAHGLSAGLATRMARELVQKARAGEDYERAEWAFLAAQRLTRPSAGVPAKRRVSGALHWPLSELPRLIAYLGQSAKPQLDLGVHVLAQAAHPRAAEDAELAASEALWQVDTLGGSRPGVMFAATSWDDAQLRALGHALTLRSDDGDLELVISLLAIGARARTTVAIAGRRQGAELVVEQLAEPLAHVRWPRIERLLAAPLRGLVGATYPPDELAIEASDPHEASQIVSAAESVHSVKCAIDGPMVRCRGSLADQGAARHALLAVASLLLRDEARALWSGTD